MRHSNKKRDNVAKSRPGSNTGIMISFTIYMCEYVREPCLINRSVKKFPQRGSKRTFHHFIGNTTALLLIPNMAW